MSRDFKDFKEKMLQRKSVAKEYDNLIPEYEVAKSLIKARMAAKMTQAEVAEKMHTSQAAIARYESGNHLPSLKTIAKYAEAVGRIISLKIAPKH